MIDLHCHILPGIDDGASNLKESLEMADKAVEQGITHILCSPHHNNGRFHNPKREVIKRVENLQNELDTRHIPLTLLEGQEVHITGDLLTDYDKDEILGCDVEDYYILIEFPTLDIPSYTDRLFMQLLSRGIHPVIVHPERNAKFRQDPNRMIEFLKMGCLGQLTAGSYLGKFGKDIQKTAQQMVAHNLTQCMASDAHAVHKRNFYLKEAFEAMARDFGEEKVKEYQMTARAIVNGDALPIPNHSPVELSVRRKKKWLGLF